MAFNDDIDATVEYDRTSGVYRASYEEDDAPSLALVRFIAAVEGTDPVEMDPLGKRLDMDALDTVLQPLPASETIQVTFSYHGYRATIRSDRTVELRPIDSDTGRSSTPE